MQTSHLAPYSAILLRSSHIETLIQWIYFSVFSTNSHCFKVSRICHHQWQWSAFSWQIYPCISYSSLDLLKPTSLLLAWLLLDHLLAQGFWTFHLYLCILVGILLWSRHTNVFDVLPQLWAFDQVWNPLLLLNLWALISVMYGSSWTKEITGRNAVWQRFLLSCWSYQGPTVQHEEAGTALWCLLPQPFQKKVEIWHLSADDRYQRCVLLCFFHIRSFLSFPLENQKQSLPDLSLPKMGSLSLLHPEASAPSAVSFSLYEFQSWAFWISSLQQLCWPIPVWQSIWSNCPSVQWLSRNPCSFISKTCL